MYRLIPVRMAIIKKSTNNKCWRGCGEKGTPLHCWWKYKLVQPLWRTVWRCLKNLGIKLPYNPAIPLLGIYPEKTITEKDTCALMLTAALFTIANTWKQLRCPSIDERIKKCSVQFSSVTQLCPTLCDPMNHSTPGLLVHHQLPQFTQTHVHRVGDAIQPCHPLSSPSPPSFNLSQHQILFK